MRGAVPTLSPRARLRWIVTAGVVLIVAFVGSSGYDAWRLYRQALVDTEREVGNLALALAEQGARNLQTVDALLRETADWYAAAGGTTAPERASELIAGRTASLPQVRALDIIDAQGFRRYSSHAPSTGFDVSNRSYFVAQRDGAARGLFVSEPVVTGGENRATLVLSRRVDDGHGRFGGVVSAAVLLDDFEQFYRALRLGSGSAINLVRDDGALIMRHISGPASVDRTFAELAGAQRPEAMKRTTPVASPVDDAASFVAVAHLRNLPLAVTVTRDRAAALEPWREEMMHVAVRTLTLMLIGALLVSAFVHQLGRVSAGERALRESEERYALAMEGSNEGHWDWDLTTDRLFLSSRMKVLHGRLESEPVVTRAGWFAHVEIDGDDERRFEAALKDHIEERTPYFELDYRVRHPDGGWRWLLSRGRCLRDAEGRPYRFVGSASDITDRKRAEAERERLEAQLRQSQKMEAMGTLAGGIAHDFNNILGAILGYGELAQRGSPEGSRVRRHLDQVMHAGGRAKALVERILAFSRSALAQREPVHVQSVVSETLELLAASLPPGVRLERRLQAGNAAVIGDPTQLHQVVMNLCTNAMHAMSGGGVLAVVLERAEVVSPLAVSHGALSLGRYVRLTVSDTGTGISPAVLERMFDPFFTTKVVGEGTGLGLPLVHGIVGDLDGAIDVATKPGEGTTFAIWLPLGGEAARPLPKAAHQAPRGDGEVVMIVDDEPALVTLAEEMLAELGYEPAGFESSVAALEAFRADPRRFDLVLTDEAMPELAGTELAREIRRLREIPIVLMSGYGGTALAARAANAGVREVLRKPLDSRGLAESLARVLRSARGVAALP